MTSRFKLLMTCVLLVPSLLSAAEPVAVPPEYGKVTYQHSRDGFDVTERWTKAAPCQGVEQPKSVSVYWLASLRRQSGATDGYVTLSFVSRSKTYLNVPGSRMTWQVDGKAYEFAHDHSLTIDDSGPAYVYEESHTIHLALASFRQVAYSSSAALQFGQISVRLHEKDKEAMRQFLSHWPRGPAGEYVIETDQEIVEALAEDKLQAELREVEKKASSALRIIERNILPKNKTQARQELQKLIEKYPATESAKKAATLLQSL